MGVTRDQQRETLETANSVLMCSLIAHVVLCVLVLVGVRRVTVVHIGHEDVVVVIHFCVAILCRDLLYQEMYSLQPTPTTTHPRGRPQPTRAHPHTQPLPHFFFFPKFKKF